MLAMLDRLCLAALMPADLRHYSPAESEPPRSGVERDIGGPQLPQLSRLIGLALLLSTVPLAAASAQQVASPSPSTYARAIAAGYKAAMYCSGIFTAGRTPAQIDADELSGIYPEYDAIVPTLRANVLPTGATVAVEYDPAQPPRLAAFQKGTGCLLAPIGAIRVPHGTYLAPGVQPPKAPTEQHWGGKSGREFPPILLDYDPPQIAPGPGGTDAHRWPLGDAGVRANPRRQVGAAIDRAFAGAYGVGAKTTGVVVLRDGKVVAERYAAGWGPFTANRTWSVGKSIAGTLVGLATQSAPDKLAVGRPEVLTQWSDRDDPRRRLRFDNLLRMASGLHSDTAGNRTDAIYFGGTAVDEQAPGWPVEVPPGTRFRYANNDILLAMLAVRQAIGDEAYRHLPDRLFQPLGMAHTQPGTDWHGNYIISSQVWSTARDLARLGQFWLQDGVWQGKRLLPEGWMRYMTTPSGPQPAAGPGYGATLWLFGPEQGLPAGSYAAQGNRGQYIMVVPSAKLVVVRRGEDPGAARFDIAKFTADILAAR